VLSLLARWCGVDIPAGLTDAAGIRETMLNAFRLDSMPRQAITFTSADDAWLHEGRRRT
jgi:hypothetical protein